MQFNVLVSGTPPLTIKWFKDKKEVSSGIDCSVQKNDTSSSLELFFSKPSDSGDYVCEISNDVGSDACQATLFVKGFYKKNFFNHFFPIVKGLKQVLTFSLFLQNHPNLPANLKK